LAKPPGTGIAHPQAQTGSTTSQSKGNTAEMIAAAIELPMTAIVELCQRWRIAEFTL
jgi:hypothetical protein